MFDVTRCTAAVKGRGFCDGEIPEASLISLCARHLRIAYSFCSSLIAEAEGVEVPDESPSLQDRHVVYYMLFDDCIKIGTTVDTAQRLKQLGAKHVLAKELGSYTLEAARQRQFSHLRIPGTREYFRIEQELLDHIKQVKTQVPVRAKSAMV